MNHHNLRRFPAILIGGPPRAGKSVLAYSLKEALSRAGVDHYLLRAAPDGEGDWFQTATPEVAQARRRKGHYTSTWVARMRRDLAARPLPFLVDVGGRPGPADEAIFDQCTHAILLVKDDASEAGWQRLMDQHNIPVIAVLTSAPAGEEVLLAERPLVRGVITGLQRSGPPASGPVFEALLARVSALFSYSPDELFNIHQQQAPTDLVVHLPRLHQRLKPGQAYNWQPQDLPQIFDYLPADDSLALYGRGPAWLYAAVAQFIKPHPFYQFDARRGWVEPARIRPAQAASRPVAVVVKSNTPQVHLEIMLPEKYLDYEPELALPVPPGSRQRGLILSGQLPIWLYTGLVDFYSQTALWVAIYYPQQNQAVVVTAQATAPYRVGQPIQPAL